MKRRKRKKSEGQNLTNEQRELKRAAVLEAFDSGQFSTLGEMAIYADVQNETVTRILKRERAEQFAEWKTQNNVGRKSVKPKTGIKALFA
jgi:predicted HTH domain antitoxin